MPTTKRRASTRTKHADVTGTDQTGDEAPVVDLGNAIRFVDIDGHDDQDASDEVGELKLNNSHTRPPVQTTMFGDAIVVDDGIVRETYTKDLIHIHDAPVSSRRNLQEMIVRKRGPNGMVEQKEFGKVAVRMKPHPQLVEVDGKIVEREDLDARELAKCRPIMTEAITTILYRGGIIEPLHMDVLAIIFNRLYERWVNTGNKSPTISLTKTEIAKGMGMGMNGRLRKEIDEALEALGGLRVTTQHMPPNASAEGKTVNRGPGMVNYTLYGMIAKTEVRTGYKRGGGRSPDVVEITFNPIVIDAMTGVSNAREWQMRTLNLTRRMRIGEPWKRQLFGILDSRFQITGRFFMPLAELWVDCLGMDAADIFSQERWRKARYRLRKAFEGLESTGYVIDLHFSTSVRNLRHMANGNGQTIEVPLGEDWSTMVEANRGDPSHRPQDVVSCKPGPEFYQGLQRSSKSLAMDLCVGLFGAEESVQMVARLGVDVINEHGWQRVKAFATAIEDRRDRLPLDAWLGTAYPMPDRAHLAKQLLIEGKEKEHSSIVAEQLLTIPSGFHAFRREVTMGMMRKTMATYPIDLEPYLDESVPVPEGLRDFQTELIVSIRVAVETILQDMKIPRFIFSRDKRVDAIRVAQYKTVCKMAINMGFEIASLHLWYARMRDDPNLPTAAKAPKFFSQEVGSIVKRLPDAVSYLSKLDDDIRSTSNHRLSTLMQALYDRFRLRLVERYTEQLRLEAIAKRNWEPTR